MFGIVEEVIGNKIYVIFSDLTRKVYINELNLDIKENNEVEIVNGQIVSVKPYNKQLYETMKQLEKQVFKK